MRVEVRNVLEGLDFEGIWLHALCSKHSTIDGDLRLPDLTFCVVEDNAMLFGCLHQLHEVPFMLLGGAAVYTYIVMNDKYASETVFCQVHSHLKDILRHSQSKWHMREPLPTTIHVKQGEV